MPALGNEIVVEEAMMTDLVIGIVVDVLRHVAVEDLQGKDIIGSQAGGDVFSVELDVVGGQALDVGDGAGDAAEFRVLNPQVRFDLFERAEEGENGEVAFGDRAAVFVLTKSGRAERQNSRSERGGTRSYRTIPQKRTAIRTPFKNQRTRVFHEVFPQRVKIKHG